MVCGILRAMTMKRLNLTPEEERARRTLDLFKRLTDLSDAKIGEALGVKHQAIAQRRDGSTRIHPHRDVPKLAAVLRIDPACFYMDDEELFEWVRSNRPDLLMAQSPWIATRLNLLAVA